MGYYGFPAYVSVAEKKAKALRAIEILRKKDPSITPVIIENTLAKSWWSKAWNKNLESYADLKNRISRGKSYVRQHCVIDLKIQKGLIKAKVKGSASKPYTVEISIHTLSKQSKHELYTMCQRHIGSIEALSQGKFPKSLETLLCDHDQGLFPSPKELTFTCDCPDRALMCKHIAASLYGIGARLDDDPLLFFELRDIDVKDLIQKSIEDKLQTMLKHAGGTSDRTIDESAIGDLFGL